MSFFLFITFEYAVYEKTLSSFFIAFGAVVVFSLWLNASVVRSQTFEKLQDYGTLDFDGNSISYYTYLDKTLSKVEFSDIEQIEIIPAQQNDKQPLEDTYWVITNSADQKIQISCMSENVWKLTNCFAEKLVNFDENKALSALMNSRGIGMVVWMRPVSKQVVPQERQSRHTVLSGRSETA